MSHYPTSAVIKWTGYPTPDSSARISMEYIKGTLKMGIVVTGTPTIPGGYACKINALPLNFELKSGKESAFVNIPSGAFSTTIEMDVTPTTDYKGKWLNFLVSISDADKNSVLQAKVGW